MPPGARAIVHCVHFFDFLPPLLNESSPKFPSPSGKDWRSKARHSCTIQRRSSSTKDFYSATFGFFPWVFSLPEPSESSKEMWKPIESGFCTVRDGASVEWGGLGVEKTKIFNLSRIAPQFFLCRWEGRVTGQNWSLNRVREISGAARHFYRFCLFGPRSGFCGPDRLLLCEK